MSSGCIVLFVHASGVRGMCRVGASIGEHVTCVYITQAEDAVSV